MAKITGTSGSDVLTGTSGDDLLEGLAGNDKLFGEAGNDTLAGAGGADTLDGGDGIDMADYSAYGTAVSVNLTTGVASGSDRLVNIEQVQGSAFNDALTGGTGSDSLYGGAGNDTFYAAAGANHMDGGDGTDTVSYAASTAGVTVDLANGGTGGDAAGDTYAGIETVLGSSSGDRLIGGNEAVTLNGGAGNDTLGGGAGAEALVGGSGIDVADYSAATAAVSVNLATGGTAGAALGDTYSSIEGVQGSAFNDVLVGGTGNESLLGGAGNDTLAGAGGADSLDGGDGIDMADYSAYGTAVSVNLTTGVASGSDRLVNIEQVQGSAFNDALTGGTGSDSLYGGAGNDTFYAAAGANHMDGGDGIDTVSYVGSTEGMIIDLASGTVSGGAGTGDVLVRVENIIASSGDDLLIGDAADNRLDAGAGNDTLIGGAGADTLIGGAGSDTASYAGSAAGVTVDLGANTASGGDAAGDSFSSIENLVGSAFADKLVGTAGSNRLEGGAGNDTLEGAAGADTLVGGAGADTADYATSTAAVRVDLEAGTASGGHASGDVLVEIENLSGSAFADRLTGNAGANRLDGAAGNDSLSGGDGNDTLTGGAGADTLVGGTGSDWLSYAGSTAVTVDLATATASGGDADGDVFSGFENVLGSSFDDRLTGDAGVNRLSGAAGNDTLIGGAGADTLDGGSGNDTADYGASAAAVAVDLAANTASGGDAQGDTLVAVENVTGSSFADRLTGNAGANVLDGGAGNDTLAGGAGADTLVGGLGIDTADYAAATAGVAVDLSTGTGTAGEAAGDALSGIENLIGSAFADTLSGDDGANLILGGAGDDLLSGAGGNDTLVGGIGADTLVGGSGRDVADYSGATAAVSLSLATGGTAGEAAGDRFSGVEDVIGSAFDDLLEGDDGANHIGGGAGNDTASYTSSAAGVTVSLAAGTGIGGSADGDTLSGIENLNGSGYDDRLIGDDAANRLSGGNGNDTLEGGRGNDTLVGGWGADRFDGGDGIDTADYSKATEKVAALLWGVGEAGEATGDTFANVENLIGSDYDDSLAGAESDNYIDGGAGNDILRGREGNDTLVGGIGADTLCSSEGNETLNGGSGQDWVVYGGSGYRPNGRPDVAVYVNLATGETRGGFAGGDALISIEHVDGTTKNDTIIGSDYAGQGPVGSETADNNLRGDEGNDLLYGLGGNDTLEGGGGNDTLVGGWGADRFDGGAGIDTADFSGATASVAVRFWGGGLLGEGEGDTFVNMENLIGSRFDDSLAGAENDNYIDGGDGNDILRGREGNDTLIGGTGNDTLCSSEGNETLIGGSGRDMLSYRGIHYLPYGRPDGSVYVNLATGEARGAFANGDTFTSIENIEGSSKNDTLIGSDYAGQGKNAAETGDNILYGWEGDDQLYGGDGNDILFGGEGADRLDGGNGWDIIDYSLATAGVTARLFTGTGEAGEAAGDTFSGIEGVIGSNHADLLAGTGDANFIDGRDGDDKINSREGNDTVWGGAGNDTVFGNSGADSLDGGDGIDTLDFSGSSGSIEVILWDSRGNLGDAAGDIYVNFENIIGTSSNDSLAGSAADNYIDGGAGNDILRGREGNDTLIGGTGNDTLCSSEGNETLNGGSGLDMVDYWGGGYRPYGRNDFAVYVNLATGEARYGWGDGDTLISIENVHGSSKNDTLIGSDYAGQGPNGGETANNVLYGNEGDDVLYGLGGNDTLEGGDGNDTLFGGAGADRFNGGNGIDTADYGDSNTGVTAIFWQPEQGAGYGAGDTFFNVENLNGSNYNDQIGGDANSNRIDGRDGDDAIGGGRGGNDTLIGGAGNDTLYAGSGTDRLDGGSGTDTLDYINATGGVDARLWQGTGAGGAAAGDVFISIENLAGSNYNDTLAGDSGNNRLEGRDGDDALGGREGNDLLYGGNGNDTLYAYGGGDYFDGGSGIDTVDYMNVNSGVDARLWQGSGSGAAAGDIYVNIENLFGSNYNDWLAGADNVNNVLDGRSGDDYLSGRIGNDRLMGGDGNDTLHGGVGADTIEGGAGIDTADYTYSGAGVTVRLFNNDISGGDAAGDRLSGIENLIGSAYTDYLGGDGGNNVLYGLDGDDYLNGREGNNLLYGGNGNDNFYAQQNGNDTMYGGSGYDTLNYSLSSTQVSITRTGGGQAIISGGGLGTRYLYEMERVVFTNTTIYL